MNKHHFRVIFSKTLQRFIVVSELAKAEGKAKSEMPQTQSAVGFLPIFATLKPLTFRLFCALGFVFSSSAFAETLIIKADPNAPKNQQPIILQTANGLPQVNIQTPNDKGLSHNKYQDFNVDKKGVILNNSHKTTQTQQAGLIQGNPYLARGEAKVILNEVTSTNPSQLKGYLEVAGKKAEVIIANPNGLHCDGCGIINATRSTMTTGKPLIEAGRVTGFQVEKGKMKVSGRGLDNSRVDYTDILAREAEINAGIWAGKNLNVVTGKNTVKQAELANADSELQITRIDSQNLSENTPHFALDVSKLGGMYAGKIHLVGTEQGLGVRNAGHIGASAENLVIDSQGKIVNQGELRAAQNLSITTNQHIENKGNIVAQSHFNSQSTDLDNQAGTIQAKSAQILATESLKNDKVGSTGSLIKSTEKLMIRTKKLTNQNTKVSQNNQSEQGIMAGHFELNADHLANQKGAIYGEQNLQLNLAQRLDNQQGEILALGELSLQGDKLDINNEQGKLASKGNLTFTANKLESEGNIESERNAIISLKQDLTLNNAFKIAGSLDFQIQGNLTNNSALRVGENLTLHTGNLSNNNGGELSGQSTHIYSDHLINRGLIDGEKTLLKTTALTNIGTGRIYGNHLAIESQAALNDKEGDKSGTIAARERLDLAVGTLTNRDHGLIFSAGDIGIGSSLDNNHYAVGKATFIDNGSATIEALGNGYMNTARLWNHDLHLKLGEDHTDERRLEYAKQREAQRYVLIDGAGSHGYFDYKNNDKHDSQSYLRLKDKQPIGSNAWVQWDYNRHTITTRIDERDPSKLLIGGDFHLSGDNLENNASTLAVGKQLLLGETIFTKNETHENLTASSGTSLKNIDIAGTIDVTDKGRWHSFHKQHKRHGATGKVWANYRTGNGDVHDIHPILHFVFNKVENAIGQPILGTNTTIEAQTEQLTPSPINGVTLTLPEQSFYQFNPDAPNGYLIEIDPRFSDRKQWLSSDYMFNALRHDHNNVQKRLGDGFYEQRLINEQVNRLTGRRFLDSYQTDYEQYKALMDEGIHYAKVYHLIPGVELTAEQMNELTSDIVWLVNQEITLPNGEKTTALVPKVYLAPRHLKMLSHNGTGAVISAQKIIGEFDGLQNDGVIAGRDLTALSAHQLDNRGVIEGDSLHLMADQLYNIGGQVKAKYTAALIGKEKVEIRSQTSQKAHQDKSGNLFDRTLLDNVVRISVSDQTGKLMISGANDIVIKGAILDSAGKMGIQGNHIEIGTVTTKNKTNYNADADNYYRLTQQQEVGTTLNAQGDITLTSQQSTHVRQGELHSEQGRLTLVSQGDIHIEEGHSQEQLSSAFKFSHHGMLQSTTHIQKHDHNYLLAQSSMLDGKHITVQADEGQLSIQGSNMVAENELSAKAKTIAIQAATNQIFEQDFDKTTKSGLMGSGGIGFTIGSKKATTETDQTKHYATVSQVGSLQGNTNLMASEDYHQQGSTVSSVEGDVKIAAKNVAILATDDSYTNHYKQTTEQKGFTIAVNIPVVQAVQNALAVVEQTKQVGESKNSRVNAMATANTAWSAYRAGQGLMQAGQTLSQMANGNLAQGAMNASVSIVYGEQKTVQTSETQGNTTTGSEVNASGKVAIQAIGAGKESDINIVGSDVSGKQGTTFLAEDEVNFLAAKQTHQERSKNKSSGFNAGVAVSYGSNGFAFGITAGGNYGKGYGNGDETTWRTSHIGDKNSQTQIISGGDSTIKGTQVRGKGISLDTENLNIESLQDTMTYKGKQMNVSGQVTVGYGFSASASYNQSKMNADYASVQEQSGLFAGDEGYQLDVRKHTDLKGGLITSTAQAETEGKNRIETGTLSYTDIENHANYSGSSFGLSGSMAMNFDTPLGKYGEAQSQKQAVNDKGEKLYTDSQGKQTTASRDSAGNANQAKLAEGLDSLTGGMSFGFGSDKESQSSRTKSGINTSNLHIRDEQAQLAKTGKTVAATKGEISTDITTDSAEQHTGKLAQNFDKERLQKELDLQREVTQKFDQTRQEVKAELYNIVDKKRENATQIRKINGGYDTGFSAQLDREATDLDEKVRWLDMGLGILQGSAGNSKTMLGVFTGTQADRVVRSATAPKEMWYQKCTSSNGDCSDNKNRRQIWSLSDLTNEEQANLKANGNVLTISNPGIFNDREDALKNAQKQNISETNQKGIIVVMNRPTGRYDGGWIATSLVSELMYAAYDKVNDKYLWGALPLNNSQKLNQDLYREAEQSGYQVDTSNHSRGGLTASIALQDMNIWKGETNIPIRKSRFYGTATNVQAYTNQLQRNGYSYTGEDGKTYQSGVYSAVHKADFVGNKWGLGLVGSNEVTGGNCWICYSHSSYFAEVPDGQAEIGRENFIKNWGELTSIDDNPSKPKLVKPINNQENDLYDKNPF